MTRGCRPRTLARLRHRPAALRRLGPDARSKRTFARYSQVAPRNGMTGAQAAAAVLRASGLPEPADPPRGRPADRPLRPAQQDAEPVRRRRAGDRRSRPSASPRTRPATRSRTRSHYRPMRVRQTLVPAATVGQSLWYLPVILGPDHRLDRARDDRAVLFRAIVLFQLVTLPVEFDASGARCARSSDSGTARPGRDRGAREPSSAPPR